jgi:hypothetical protein
MISFQAVINSSKFAILAAGDIWFMDADFQIFLQHYGFADKL